MVTIRYRMPFGVHVGKLLKDIPDEYIEWLHSLDNLREPLRGYVDDEQNRRRHSSKSNQQQPDIKFVNSFWGDRELARELIRAGFRKLSHKYHPDTGGDCSSFVSLKEVYERLLKVIK